MRLKKGISVRTQEDFFEFARLFNLERPNWTVHNYKRYRGEICCLSHRPYKRYKITNRPIPSRDSQASSNSFAWDYIYASEVIVKSGDKMDKKSLVNFGFQIAYKPKGEDRYTGMQLRLERGRKSEMKKAIKTANALEKKGHKRAS
ncbi:MAG: hypothetical protein P8J32_07170 [bacterium]|nr:hypothetical protein [bacterium]